MTEGKAVAHPGRGVLAAIVGAQTPQGARRALWAYLFISPWVLGLVLFIVGPMVVSLWWSFHAYDLLSPPHWVGLANYEYALSGGDDLFWPSLGRSFYYA